LESDFSTEILGFVKCCPKNGDSLSDLAHLKAGHTLRDQRSHSFICCERFCKNELSPLRDLAYIASFVQSLKECNVGGVVQGLRWATCDFRHVPVEGFVNIAEWQASV
jgi:hypothetical protein